MELIIKDMTLPEAIEFNFDEIKQELSEKVSQYQGLVYTDDQIKDAKKDVAELRKFAKVLSDERIAIKKKILKPYEVFESKVKELDQIVSEPIALIDSQIKEFDAQKRQEKHDAIEDVWSEMDVPEGISLDQVMDLKWLNASVSLSKVSDELTAKVEQIKTNLATLANLPEFGFEASEVYKTTLDMNKAISEGQRLSEIQRKKEEAKKLEEVEKAVEEAVVESVAEEIEEGFIPSFDENQAVWRKYNIELTNDQKTILEQFLISSGIKYQSI